MTPGLPVLVGLGKDPWKGTIDDPPMHGTWARVKVDGTRTIWDTPLDLLRPR